MSSLMELLKESCKVNGIIEQIDTFKMIEKEVQKYIPSKFISWKYEINTLSNHSREYIQHLFFLSEKGSVFQASIELVGYTHNNRLPYVWGINSIPSKSKIECYTRDNCSLSKFEKEESYIITNNDIIVKNFKNTYFNKNLNVINDFVHFCENLIQKENDLQTQKEKYIELLKISQLEEEKTTLKNKAYQDALQSNLKRQYEEELRVRKLEQEENNLRIKAQHDAIISSLKREHEEELKMIREENNKNHSLFQRIKNIFI